jgi:hypothetical protein
VQVFGNGRDFRRIAAELQEGFLSYRKHRNSPGNEAMVRLASQADRFTRLIMNYDPRPFDGMMDLVICDDAIDLEQDYCWDKVVLRGVNLHRISGAHGSYLNENVGALRDVIVSVIRT